MDEIKINIHLHRIALEYILAIVIITYTSLFKSL